MTTVRKTGGRNELDAIYSLVESLRYRNENALLTSGAIADGTTAGALRTTAAISYKIHGQVYTKASTDDLWGLTGIPDLLAAQHQATYLYLDNAGAAGIESSAIAASAAAAIAALPTPNDDRCVVGVFVAGPLTDYDIALVAQGTVYNGLPEAVGLEAIDLINA